ncbi:hypothetical protein MMC11_000863 [Xylographa trunciseda]|nr:hypothetical protein [Xylographa trunciseda]
MTKTMQLALLGLIAVSLTHANPVLPPPQKALFQEVSFQNEPQSKEPPSNTPLPNIPLAKALPSNASVTQASSSKAPTPKVPSSKVPASKVPSQKDTSCPSQYIAVFMDVQQSRRLQTATIPRKPDDPSWRLDNGMSEHFGGLAGSSMNCGISDSDCGSPPGFCGDLKSRAGYQILTLMASLNHILNNMHDDFHDANGAVTPTIVNDGALLGTFGLSINSPDIKILLAVLAAVLALAGGLLGAADAPLAGAVLGGIGPGTMGIAINALPPATPADLGSALAALDNAVDTAYKQWSTQIFSIGFYAKPRVDQSGSLFTSLEKLMENGALLRDPVEWTSNAPGLPQSFIAFDNFARGKGTSLITNAANNNCINLKADLTKVSATINNQCFYLLGSTGAISFCPNPHADPTNPTLPCPIVDKIPGGTSDVLTGSSTAWAGPKLSDLISASVNTWTNSGKNSGAPAINVDTLSSTYSNSLETLPFLNSIPVCDYTGTGDPGARCPALTSPPPDYSERAKVSGSPKNATRSGVAKASTGLFKPARTQAGKAPTAAASGRPESSRAAMPSGAAPQLIHRGGPRRPSDVVGNVASMASPHPFAPSFGASRYR